MLGELVTELCDKSRFAKNLTATLARVRPLAGDGLFTAYHGEPNWQRAHDVLLPGFSYAGLRAYHGAMLDINCKLIDRWDGGAGVGPVDVSTDLQKLAMDTVALAGFGSRVDSSTTRAWLRSRRASRRRWGNWGLERRRRCLRTNWLLCTSSSTS